MSGGLITGTGNWTTDGNWSSGNKPVTDDKAIAPASMGNNITDPSGAAEAIKLAGLLTHAGFAAKFGDVGAPIRTAATLVHVMGTGEFHYECHKDTGVGNFVTDEVRVECALPNTMVYVGSDPTDAGDIIRVHLSRGTLTLPGTIKFADSGGMVIVSKMEGLLDATLYLVESSEVLPDLIQTAGRSFIDNPCTRLSIAGGTCTKDKSKAITVDVFAGGTLIYNHGAASGDVIMCRVHTGGILDLNQNGVEKVFDTVVRFRGGKIRRNGILHTFTTFLDLEEEG